MMVKLMTWLRAGGIALLLAFGLVVVQPAAAQDTATEVAIEATETADAADDGDDGGFDDWGLFGLLGLLGLGGLYRRQQPASRAADRGGFTSATDRIDDRGL